MMWLVTTMIFGDILWAPILVTGMNFTLDTALVVTYYTTLITFAQFNLTEILENISICKVAFIHVYGNHQLH